MYLFPDAIAIDKVDLAVVNIQLSDAVTKKIARGAKPNGNLLTNSSVFYFITNKIKHTIGNPIKYD